MAIATAERSAIRVQVLRGIALNRTPGYHFPGNFLDISFDQVAAEHSQLSVDAGAHCRAAGGEMHFGVLGILADLALSATIRAGLERHQRLGTVSFSLQLTGAPLVERLVAQSEFQGFVRGAQGQQGMSRVIVRAQGISVASGYGSFMVLRPPKDMKLYPLPHRKRGDPLVVPPDESTLSDAERVVLSRADRALDAATANRSFIDHLWGASGMIENGPHMGNRVGHMQGGLLLAFAAATANDTLGAGWRTSGVSASYISPGEGALLQAQSRVIHRGGLTAVVHTQVLGIEDRLVLDLVSQHAAQESAKP